LFFVRFCGKLFAMSLLGERLRQTREARGIASLQAEMDTRIRASVIEALEQADYDKLPPEPFLRGLIRTYATYLGLDSEEMLGLYIVDRTPPPVQPTRPAPIVKPPAARPESPPPAGGSPVQPPLAAPEENAAPTLALPPTEPIRKPAAIRLPSLRPPIPRPPALKPSVPEPPTSPESLAPPEPLASAPPASISVANEPASRVHATRRPMSLPIIGAILVGVICVCVISALILFTQFSPMILQLTGLTTVTPTRLLPTRTPTLRPGANPTAIPTIAATAPPLPGFLGGPTATLKTAPRSTLETYAGLHLDVVQVTEPITLRVGIDGAMVFSGQMQPGATRAWSAKDSLYVEIENPKGATLEFNGNAKPFASRNFAETKSLERQWTLNEKGTPLAVTPIVPGTPPPRAPNPAPLVLPDSRGTPTPTLTPFS
jgi:hypothetical protein